MDIISVQQNDDNVIKLIESLADEIWKEHYTSIIGIEQVEYMLDKFQSSKAIKKQLEEGYIYYLLEDNGTPAGYFSLIKQDNVLFLSKLYIKSSFRGKGAGRKSVEYITNIAKGENLDKIRLTVNKYNHNSIEAYKKFGFVIVDSVVNDIGAGFVMDDYIMEKTV